MAEALASFTTSGPDVRACVEIDDVKYPLAVEGDLGVAAGARMQRLGAQWEQMGDADPAEVTDELIDNVEAGLLWAAKVILPTAPPEVIAALTDTQRMELLTAFSEATGAGKRAAPAKNRAARRTKATAKS